MHQYLILRNPGHNRIYYMQAENLALAELKICSQRFSNEPLEIKAINIGGISYLSFALVNQINQADLLLISRLSFFFALFQKQGDLLKPIASFSYQAVPFRIAEILKYPGKTNELFTKMMLNVAMLSCKSDLEEPIQLLDPVAGRGTTLFESLVYGYDSYGIEIDRKSVHESVIFMQRFLKNERYKHQKTRHQIYGKDKSEARYMDKMEFSVSKEDFKNDKRLHFGIVNGDTRQANKYFNKKSFHLIVGDLPYGIGHGNTIQKNTLGSRTRNPYELLEGAIPAWVSLLKKGGVICLAWNSFVLSRDRISDLFLKSGLSVCDTKPYTQFEHMVDQSIKRDMIVSVNTQ
jgi:hypothetical protein